MVNMALKMQPNSSPDSDKLLSLFPFICTMGEEMVGLPKTRGAPDLGPACGGSIRSQGYASHFPCSVRSQCPNAMEAVGGVTASVGADRALE